MEKTNTIGALGAQSCMAVQDRLFRYLKSGRIHPALLFVGPDKHLKFQVAKGMAKLLFCLNKQKKAFCNDCKNCQRIEKEIHPDVYFFTERDEESLKIESVREIISQMRVTPIEGPYKICIVDEAHRMNAAAANAFLKTLEEPGEDRFFILTTTQSGSILPTISSRCIEFVFRPENEKLNISQDSIDKYLSLLKEAIRTKNYSLLTLALEEKQEALNFLQFLQSELHQCLISKESDKNTLSLFSHYSSHELTLKFEAIITLEGQLRSNANYGLMIESLLRNHFSGVSL